MKEHKEKFINLKEASKRFGLSQAYLRVLARTGQGRGFYRPLRNWLADPIQFEAWIRESNNSKEI